jgi:hypothetical protein
MKNLQYNKDTKAMKPRETRNKGEKKMTKFQLTQEFKAQLANTIKEKTGCEIAWENDKNEFSNENDRFRFHILANTPIRVYVDTGNNYSNKGKFHVGASWSNRESIYNYLDRDYDCSPSRAIDCESFNVANDRGAIALGSRIAKALPQWETIVGNAIAKLHKETARKHANTELINTLSYALRGRGCEPHEIRSFHNDSDKWEFYHNRTTVKVQYSGDVSVTLPSMTEEQALKVMALLQTFKKTEG